MESVPGLSIMTIVLIASGIFIVIALGFMFMQK